MSLPKWLVLPLSLTTVSPFPQFLPLDFELAIPTVFPCEICFNTPCGISRFVKFRTFCCAWALIGNRKANKTALTTSAFDVCMSDSPFRVGPAHPDREHRLRAA